MLHRKDHDDARDDRHALAEQLRKVAHLVEAGQRDDALILDTMQQVIHYCCHGDSSGENKPSAQPTATSRQEDDDEFMVQPQHVPPIHQAEKEPSINTTTTSTTSTTKPLSESTPPSVNTPTTTNSNAAPMVNPQKERIRELRKLAHGAGINTHGMEVKELEQVIAHLAQQFEASHAASPTTATAPPPRVNSKKERIKELRKLAHGAGINTHGMEVEELEQVIAHLARQHDEAYLAHGACATTTENLRGT